MFCLYTLPLARPAQAKVQMLTTSSCIVKSIPWNLFNLNHLYLIMLIHPILYPSLRILTTPIAIAFKSNLLSCRIMDVNFPINLSNASNFEDNFNGSLLGNLTVCDECCQYTEEYDKNQTGTYMQHTESNIWAGLSRNRNTEQSSSWLWLEKKIFF